MKKITTLLCVLIYSTLLPTSVNADGILVTLVGYDCDWDLDLKFFRRDGDHFFREFLSYKNTDYTGECIKYPKEGGMASVRSSGMVTMSCT